MTFYTVTLKSGVNFIVELTILIVKLTINNSTKNYLCFYGIFTDRTL